MVIINVHKQFFFSPFALITLKNVMLKGVAVKLNEFNFANSSSWYHSIPISTAHKDEKVARKNWNIFFPWYFMPTTF